MKVWGTGPSMHKGTTVPSKPVLNVKATEMANSNASDTETGIIARTVEGPREMGTASKSYKKNPT